jgi:hypothetical protein
MKAETLLAAVVSQPWLKSSKALFKVGIPAGSIANRKYLALDGASFLNL